MIKGVTWVKVVVSPLMIAIGSAGLPGRLMIVSLIVIAPSGVSVVPGLMMNCVRSLLIVAVIVVVPMTSAGSAVIAVVKSSELVMTLSTV